jgi:phospholipid/cholesterol/gamma-HCH transport system substrate-binding protein
VTRRPARWSVALAATTAIALALGGCGFSLQSLPTIGGISGATYPVHAVFANVLNLPIDAQVRVGAEVVGEVGSISTSNFAADVTLDIKRSVDLVQGTTAEVRFDNPLGDEYVLLQAPVSAAHAQPLRSGALIPESATSIAPSVEDTFGALSLLLNGGGINQLQTIIQQLNDTFNGNQPQIRSLLSTITTAVTTLASGKVPVDNALAAIEGLSQKLDGNGGAGAATIGTGVDTIAPAIGVLASENTDISNLLSSLSNLGAVGTQLAVQAGQNSVNDVRDLLPVVDQLNAVSQQLGPDLATLSQFETETPKVAPGGYLQVSVIANVILPPGDFTATAASTAAAHSAGSAAAGSAATGSAPGSAATGSAATGARAVTALLEGGLL